MGQVDLSRQLHFAEVDSGFGLIIFFIMGSDSRVYIFSTGEADFYGFSIENFG